jgi:hypothetical protein
MKTSGKKNKRTVLIILSNRVNRSQKPRFLEMVCDDQGNILTEKKLRSAPKDARFDEVWENDEGRTEFASCFRFKRLYSHKLQKKS